MKILIIVLFFSAMIFGQTYFEIVPKVAFQDTVTWVSFSDNVIVNLGLGNATWTMDGCKLNYTDPDSLGGRRHFLKLITKKVEINYSGQSVTRNAQKNATATKFNLIYTGVTQ